MLAQAMPWVLLIHLESKWDRTYTVNVHSPAGAVDGYNVQKNGKFTGSDGGMKRVTADREQIAGIGALWYLRPMRGVAQPG